MKRLWFLTLNIFLSAVFFSSEASAQVERYERVALYCVNEVDGRASITFDGFRKAFLTEDTVISELSSDSSLRVSNISELAEAIGKIPDWESVKIGEVVGKELGDVLEASLSVENDVVKELVVDKRLKRPLVGVSWTGENNFSGGQRVVSEALLRNGMQAYLIPQIRSEADCDQFLSNLEGFVMPGGTNMNPQLYGEVPYPHGSAKIDDARDANDVLVTRWILRHNVPGLWICRGVQALNVSLGGALIQDVPTYLATLVLRGDISYLEAEPIPDKGAPGLTSADSDVPCMPRHFRARAYGVNHMSARHSLGSSEQPQISSDSKFLLPIVGQNYYPSVLSWHHQAADPDRIGEGLTVVAHSPDGIIEALEYQSNDFALGTQFHFEYDINNEDKELQRFGCSFFKALYRCVLDRRTR